MRLDGLDGPLAVNVAGDLVVPTTAGDLVLPTPVLHAETPRGPRPVVGAYHLLGPDRFSLEVGERDPGTRS